MPQIRIPADKRWFPTGITLVRGVEYRFTAQGTWHDASISCGPEGYTLTQAVPAWQWQFFRLVQGFRPLDTGDRWFQLIGKVGDSVFEIGAGVSCSVLEDGELLRAFYHTTHHSPVVRWIDQPYRAMTR